MDSSEPRWTKEVLDKRRQRAKILAWLLAGFVVLIIFVTMARIGGNIAKRPPIGLQSSLLGMTDD